MRTLILLAVLVLTSCVQRLRPIEYYKGEEYIITKITEQNETSEVQLKNDKFIIHVRLLNFDLELYNYKVGDTIK